MIVSSYEYPHLHSKYKSLPWNEISTCQIHEFWYKDAEDKDEQKNHKNQASSTSVFEKCEELSKNEQNADNQRN